jgi:hypothetical protein
VIAGVITKTGIRKNIHWFETEEEALNHLSKLEMAAPAKETVA